MSGMMFMRSRSGRRRRTRNLPLVRAIPPRGVCRRAAPASYWIGAWRATARPGPSGRFKIITLGLVGLVKQFTAHHGNVGTARTAITSDRTVGLTARLAADSCEVAYGFWLRSRITVHAGREVVTEPDILACRLTVGMVPRVLVGLPSVIRA